MRARDSKARAAQKGQKWYAQPQVIAAIILSIGGLTAAIITTVLSQRVPTQPLTDTVAPQEPPEVKPTEHEDRLRARSILLHHDRIEVAARWRTIGGINPGTAIPLRGDRGVMVAPGESDFSVLVDVLDATHTVFGPYWVFLAIIPREGVTGEIIVTDNTQSKTSVYPVPEHDESIGEAWFSVDDPRAVTAAALCQASRTSLCLVENRFRVTVRWTDHRLKEQEWNDGLAVRFSGSAGFFGMTAKSTWSWVVKAVSGGTDGDSYIFRVASCTDVPWTMSITDLWTGAVKEVHNEAGHIKGCIADTHPFR